MKESLKKLFNLAVLKEFEETEKPAEENDDTLAYLEYKKCKDRKNGINFKSTETEGYISFNKDKQNVRDMFDVHSNSTLRTEKENLYFTFRNEEQPTTFIYKYNKYSDKKSTVCVTYIQQ
ncbi:hypothetical protein GLOIN_2v1763873 [Rhizophagus clarus]|uniref:Uncharacterized protein n=1 Tax=Rhizophagus clarus TaxID=94130 RepID=A0A8H3KWN4_9GLOM|nr:hypothetical protein GLOIN_2v1763873 [Rhizophagus clarus]